MRPLFVRYLTAYCLDRILVENYENMFVYFGATYLLCVELFFCFIRMGISR